MATFTPAWSIFGPISEPVEASALVASGPRIAVSGHLDGLRPGEPAWLPVEIRNVHR